MSNAIGETLQALAETIADRRDAGDTSYTYRLLTGKSDDLLKKVMEEAGEVALAGKDADGLIRGLEQHAKMQNVPQGRIDNLERRKQAAIDHVRYEMGDVFYHILVLMERYGITLDDLAAELNTRMKPEELPEGAALLKDEQVNRGR